MGSPVHGSGLAGEGAPAQRLMATRARGGVRGARAPRRPRGSPLVEAPPEGRGDASVWCGFHFTRVGFLSWGRSLEPADFYIFSVSPHTSLLISPCPFTFSSPHSCSLSAFFLCNLYLHLKFFGVNKRTRPKWPNGMVANLTDKGEATDSFSS